MRTPPLPRCAFLTINSTLSQAAPSAARKLLDQYLASLDILSRRADLSDDAKAALQKSLTATLAQKINDAVSITPAP